MKSYLAVFTGKPDAMQNWEKLPQVEREKKEKAGMAAWKKWQDEHSSAIVEAGGPLSRTKLISKTGISDIRNNLGAFTIVKAKSQDEAAKMFENHPHFTIFPGDGVEVMEVLPIPGEDRPGEERKPARRG